MNEPEPTPDPTGPSLEDQAAALEAAASGADTPSPAPSLELSEEQLAAFPEKFRGAANPVAALLDSYGELSTKLGAPTPNDPQEGANGEEAEAVLDDARMQALAAEYAEHGKLTPETLASLATEFRVSPQVVEDYIQTKRAAGDAQNQAMLAQAGIDESAWQTMSSWAGKNWSKDRIEAWDQLASNSNPEVRRMALETLKSAYQAVQGQRVTRLDGDSPTSSGQAPLRSQDEIAVAMNDKRWGVDMAYSAQVEERIAAGLNL